jgi:putative PEP-CTERM system TPR-repeat lipoprotein
MHDSDPAGAIVFFKNALEKDQNYFDARYQLAKAYFSVNRYEQAEKEFQKVLRQNPARKDIKLDLAKSLNFLNKPEMAIEEAEGYLKTTTDPTEAYEVMGVSHAIKNEPDLAEKYFLQTLQRDPERLSAKIELAALYLASQNFNKGRQLIADIISKDSANVRAYYMLGNLEIAQGNRDKAIDCFKKIYEIKRTESAALYKVGILYIEKGDLDSADKVATDLLRAFPKRSDGPRLKGIFHYYRKNYLEAIAELQESIKILPTIEAHYFLGLCLYEREELENALSQFRIILNNSPGAVRARLLTGVILLKQKRADDAIAEMKKLIEGAPRYALAHNILGSAYMAKGLYDEGMKELNKTTELDPKLVDAYLKKGMFNLNKGNEKEAETDLQSAIRIAPEVLNTRMILASYYMRHNNFNKAQSLLTEGLTGKKGDAAIYNYLAAVMLVQKKKDEGLKYLSKSKDMDPEFYAAYFNLALYYATEGNQGRALSEYQAVLQRDPLNTNALLNIATLMELTGHENDALANLRKATQSKSESAYHALANFYLKRKEAAKALAVIDEAIKVLPRNSVLLEMKGRILLGEKKYKDALKVFDDLEVVAPDKGLPFKIKTFMAMNEQGKAREQANRVIALKPNSAFGYTLMASIYENQNDIGRAIEEMNKGLRLDKGNLQAMLTLGNLYAKNRRSDLAMAAYQSALQINPDFTPAIFAQGVLLEGEGKKKAAV